MSFLTFTEEGLWAFNASAAVQLQSSHGVPAFSLFAGSFYGLFAFPIKDSFAKISIYLKSQSAPVARGSGELHTESALARSLPRFPGTMATPRLGRQHFLSLPFWGGEAAWPSSGGPACPSRALGEGEAGAGSQCQFGVFSQRARKHSSPNGGPKVPDTRPPVPLGHTHPCVQRGPAGGFRSCGRSARCRGKGLVPRDIA